MVETNVGEDITIGDDTESSENNDDRDGNFNVWKFDMNDGSGLDDSSASIFCLPTRGFCNLRFQIQMPWGTS